MNDFSHVCLPTSRLSTFTTKTCSPQQTSFTRNRRPLATVWPLIYFLPLYPSIYRLSPFTSPTRSLPSHVLPFYDSTPALFCIASRIIFVRSHISLPTYFAWTPEFPVRTCLRRQDANSATLLSILLVSLASSLVPVTSEASSKCVLARNPSRPGVFFLSKKKRMLPVRQDR